MTLFNDFMSLIYPRLCSACESVLFKHENYLCTKCSVDLPKSKNSFAVGKDLHFIFAGRIPFQNAIYLYEFEKSGRVQKLIHAIKYQGQHELAEYLGEQLFKLYENESILETIDFIFPIPLHAKKLKQRGYNQSERFAKGISNKIIKPLHTHNLIRQKQTSTQTKKKKFERWENVEGVFAIKNKNELIGKHILLVDDVITTGATIEAACQALSQIENVKISIASIAFAKSV